MSFSPQFVVRKLLFSTVLPKKQSDVVSYVMALCISDFRSCTSCSKSDFSTMIKSPQREYTRVQASMACTVCTVFIFLILTCPGQCLRHL